MEGEQLPKATMNTYIKDRATYPYSGQFLAKMLFLAKEFISRISDKANVMCQSHSKKTINAEHLEAALIEYGLTDHLEDLKALSGNIKQINQLKKEASQRIEEMLAKQKELEKQRRQKEDNQPQPMVERQAFNELNPVEIEDNDDEDYEKMAEEKVQAHVISE